MTDRVAIAATVPDAIVDGVWGGPSAQAPVATWMQARLGGDIVDVPFRAFGFVNDKGDLIGGAYFYNHHKSGGRSDITVAVAFEPEIAENPIAFRAAIRGVLSFPFIDLGLRRVSAEIEATNVASIDLAHRCGFVEEGRKPFAGREGADVVIMGLYRDACPFFKD